jgi:hypothetical protein
MPDHWHEPSVCLLRAKSPIPLSSVCSSNVMRSMRRPFVEHENSPSSSSILEGSPILSPQSSLEMDLDDSVLYDWRPPYSESTLALHLNRDLNDLRRAPSSTFDDPKSTWSLRRRSSSCSLDRFTREFACSYVRICTQSRPPHPNLIMASIRALTQKELVTASTRKMTSSHSFHKTG